MVAQGACAAGPVLLACHQSNHYGLARRLPSRGVGVWCCAPPLPLRVQCPVCVCAALARGQARRGRCRFSLPPPRLPAFLAPLAVRIAGCPVRVSLAVACWYAIPRSLCVPPARLSRLSGVCRVSVVCVCARAPGACLPPHPVGLTRVLRAAAVQGAGKAVPGGPCPSTFSALIPCCACLVKGGPGPVLTSPCLSPSRVPPGEWARVAGAVLSSGVGSAGVGTPHQPTGHALAASVLHCGGGRRASVGVPSLGTSGVRHPPSSGSPSLRLAAGALCRFALGVWGAGVGTGHQSHSARSSELAGRTMQEA